MKEKHKDKKIWFHKVYVNVEWCNKHKKKNGKNRHLCENNSSLFVFFGKKKPVEDESKGNSYENREESHEREYIRENSGGLERTEKNICEK